MNFKELWSKYKEIILYIIFGVLTTAVNILAFACFNNILGEDLYLISNVIAWVIAVVFAYVVNKLWVFESKSWNVQIVMKEATGFLLARLFSLAVEEAGMWSLIDLMGFDRYSLDLFSIEIGGKMLVKIFLAIIVVILNYIFSKLFIFKKKK